MEPEKPPTVAYVSPWVTASEAIGEWLISSRSAERFWDVSE